MIEEAARKQITSDAEGIKGKLKGAYLYGHPIDPNDNNALILAAYLMGWNDGLGLKQSMRKVDEILPSMAYLERKIKKAEE